MGRLEKDQLSLRVLPKNDLDLDLQEFLIDRQARNLSHKTLLWYRQSLDLFRKFLVHEGLNRSCDIEASTLRQFLIHLKDRGHNPGGIRNIFGAVRAFLNWFEDENAPAGWTNPLRRVRSPRVSQQPLEPVNLSDLQKMLATCERNFTGVRDRAILVALLDSGCRASEFLELNIDDLDMQSGAVIVRKGKGGKKRVAFLGAKTRREVLRYLRVRADMRDLEALWVTVQANRLTYAGLRQIIRRRSTKAGIRPPSLHSFRRAFALLSLRNGMDVYSLQRLMGHSDLSVLRRYLAQTREDLQRAHERAGPVDHML